MAGKRRWLSAIVATAIGLAGAVIPVLAQAVAEATDFQVLAVKPEKLGKSFRLIPVGESTLDPGAYDAVVESLPVSMFGGIKLPDYDEKAERTQCRAACIANKGCTTFIYVSRAKDRPLGLCRLRRAVEQQTITAVPLPPPVAEPAPAPAIVRESEPVVDLAEVAAKAPPAKISIGGKAKSGHISYLEADAPETPVTFRFDTSVTGVVATVRARDIQGPRAWVTLDALDASGKRLQRSGVWVANDDAPQKVNVTTKGEKIASIKVATRGANTLIVDRVEFERVAPAVAETEKPVAEVKEPAAPVVEEVAEVIPPPPVPEAEAIDVALPLPPRAVGVEATADVAQPVPSETVTAETTETAAVEPQPPAAAPVNQAVADAAPVAAPLAPVAPKVEAPASTPAEQELQLLAAAGVAAFLLGGAGIYRSNYRARTLKRLNITVLSDGMDRHTVGVEAEQPDMSMRFAVLTPANVGARNTSITIVPDGVAA